MRLINLKTNQPIVEFKQGEVCFHNKFLEKEMRLLGIPIPNGLRTIYEGQDFIFLGSPLFEKAFREIYYPSLDLQQFLWTEF